MVKPGVTLQDLYNYRDRVKWEILGQSDDEYRSELEHLLSCVNREIKQLKKAKSGTADR